MLRRSLARYVVGAASSGSSVEPATPEPTAQPERPVRRSRPSSAVAPPMEPSKVAELFPPEIVARWPRGYRPSAKAAFLMFPKGVPLGELIDARRSIRSDESNTLQRELAGDYRLWVRSRWEEHAVRVLRSQAQHRALRRVLSRNRLPSLDDVRVAFELFPPRAATSAVPLETSPGAPVTGTSYVFTPYAKMQGVAMSPLDACTSLSDRVLLPDFRAVRNVLHMDYDEMGPMRYVALRTKEDVFYTQEFVAELALYLRSRIEALPTAEERARPVLAMFGEGRLAQALNETCVLPTRVVAARLPTPRAAAVAAAAAKRNAASSAASSAPPPSPPRQEQQPLPLIQTPLSFFETFPVEDAKPPQALARHAPSIVIVEPHSDRDWTAELRGFHTVREVLFVGPVDSPAMCSFSFPWLSFGVNPGADTYWMYSESLRRMHPPAARPGAAAARGGVTAGSKDFMPTDPPHVMQGYERHTLDHLSRLVVYCNDSAAYPNQSRVLTYRRTTVPSPPPSTPSAPPTEATPTTPE